MGTRWKFPTHSRNEFRSHRRGPSARRRTGCSCKPSRPAPAHRESFDDQIPVGLILLAVALTWWVQVVTLPRWTRRVSRHLDCLRRRPLVRRRPLLHYCKIAIGWGKVSGIGDNLSAFFKPVLCYLVQSHPPLDPAHELECSPSMSLVTVHVSLRSGGAARSLPPGPRPIRAVRLVRTVFPSRHGDSAKSRSACLCALPTLDPPSGCVQVPGKTAHAAETGRMPACG